MPNAFLNKKSLIFRKTQFLRENGSKPSKTLVSTQNIEKSSIEHEKVFHNLQLMRNAFLKKKWSSFRKTQFLAHNSVKPSKTLVSTQNIEKCTFEQKRSFSTYS